MNNLFDAFKHDKIVVVANKPPVTPKIRNREEILERSVGGLTCALEPLVRDLHGQWFYTLKTSDKEKYKSLNNLPYTTHFLELTETEYKHYYEGFSNNQLWPICHNFTSNMSVKEDDWETYISVNNKMADLIVSNTDDSDFIWVNDYHFFLLPSLLKERNPNLKVAFFLHIPFPNQEIFRILPHRQELICGLLGADLIGFHTDQYVNNFLDCTNKLVPKIEVDFQTNTLIIDKRQVVVKAFPISIDEDYFNKRALSKEVKELANSLKASYNSDLIGISIDRLDYSKGPIDRLLAIEKFFDLYPEYIDKITFIQLAVPSRENIETYRHLKQQVDELTGRLSGKFSTGGWSPVHYLYRTMPTDELIAHYLISDIALVVPLRDGMNIVAKEYVATKVNQDGVLILSEFTGSAEELKDALIVNPYDTSLVAHTIKKAIDMSKEEKQKRLTKLQNIVKTHNLFKWVKDYLSTFIEIEK